MICFGLTDKGVKRDINEDSILIDAKTLPCTILAVADGMGGANAGEIASAKLVEILPSILKTKLSGLSLSEEIGTAFIEAINEANLEIYNLGMQNTSTNGMGTTLTIALVYKKFIVVANVGDSRTYIIKHGEGTQITEDHSYVEMLVRNGSITKEQALNHPRRNEITRAIGTGKETEVDVFVREYERGDILLLCSDGLTKMVRDEDIFYLTAHLGVRTCVRELVKLANRTGGIDNVSVVMAKL